MIYTYTIKTNHGEFSLSQNDLDDYRALLNTYKTLKGELSNVFLVDLICHERIHGIDPFQVIQSLIDEETGYNLSKIKKSTQFSRKPLKGLWHKHYFSGRFVAQNVQNQLPSKKLRNTISEVMEGVKGKIITEKEAYELSKEIAHKTVIEPFENRKTNCKLTGEWTIFAKNDGINYYLCMATHQQDDFEIFKKIGSYCTHEFPFLKEILETG